MTLRSRYANGFVQGNSNPKPLFLGNECVSPVLNSLAYLLIEEFGN